MNEVGKREEKEENFWRRVIYFIAGKHLEKDLFLFGEEKKSEDLTGGKYLAKENTLMRRRRRTEKENEKKEAKGEIFGEGNYFFAEEREKEENIQKCTSMHCNIKTCIVPLQACSVMAAGAIWKFFSLVS